MWIWFTAFHRRSASYSALSTFIKKKNHHSTFSVFFLAFYFWLLLPSKIGPKKAQKWKTQKKALKRDKISELGFFVTKTENVFKPNIVKAKPILNSILHRKVCDQLWFLDILVVGIHVMEPLDNGSYWSIGSIDKMASLSIGIWNWIGYIGGHAYVQRCWNRGYHVLD